MELSDKVGGVREVGGRLPSWCIIALPLNQVLEPVVVKAAIHDGLDLPLLLAIDYDGWWWWCDLSWIVVIGRMLQ